MDDFIQMFAAHLSPELVRRAERAPAGEVAELFGGIELPEL